MLPTYNKHKVVSTITAEKMKIYSKSSLTA